MCGICGIVSNNGSVFRALHSEMCRIQHRGFDGHGFSLDAGQELQTHTFTGRVGSVDKEMPGMSGIGHVRYKTSGTCEVKQTQPFSNARVALVHNGQIESDTTPDSLYLFEQLANCQTEAEVFAKVKSFHHTVKGAYACILQMAGVGLFVFRDPHGIRPLCYRRKKDLVVVSSENMGHMDFKDILPGSCMLFRLDGSKEMHAPPIQPFRPCVFEYIYFAHPTSTMNGIHVKTLRQQLGRALGIHILQSNPTFVEKLDWVAPVPKSAVVGAQSLANALGKSYVDTLRTTQDRSFILPTQAERELRVTRKFELLGTGLVQGKRILIVDDSIIRGTTMRFLIQLFREAGVQEISVASLSPPVKHQNRYGIDIPSEDTLLVNKGDVRYQLGADHVFYLPIDRLMHLMPGIEWEASMFTGDYIS